jgi:hypothetical protein
MRTLLPLALLAVAAGAAAQMGAPTDAGSPGTSLGSSPPKAPPAATAVCERFKGGEKQDCERRILGKAELGPQKAQPGPQKAPGKSR